MPDERLRSPASPTEPLLPITCLPSTNHLPCLPLQVLTIAFSAVSVHTYLSTYLHYALLHLPLLRVTTKPPALSATTSVRKVKQSKSKGRTAQAGSLRVPGVCRVSPPPPLALSTRPHQTPNRLRLALSAIRHSPQPGGAAAVLSLSCLWLRLLLLVACCLLAAVSAVPRSLPCNCDRNIHPGSTRITTTASSAASTSQTAALLHIRNASIHLPDAPAAQSSSRPRRFLFSLHAPKPRACVAPKASTSTLGHRITHVLLGSSPLVSLPDVAVPSGLVPRLVTLALPPSHKNSRLALLLLLPCPVTAL